MATLMAMAEGGASSHAIARAIGISAPTVRRRMVALDLRRPKPAPVVDVPAGVAYLLCLASVDASVSADEQHERAVALAAETLRVVREKGRVLFENGGRA